MVPRDRDEWIRFETPAIISRDLLDRAQIIRKDNQAHIRRRPRGSYLLASHIFCKDCGAPFYSHVVKAIAGQTRGGENYKHQGRNKGCRNQSTRANLLEPRVIEKIVETLRDTDKLEEAYKKAASEQEHSRGQKTREIDDLAARLNKAQQKKAKLLDIYADPDINLSKSEYMQQRDRIDSEINMLTDKVEEIKKIMNGVFQDDLESIFLIFKDLKLTNAEWVRNNITDLINRFRIRVYVAADGSFEIHGLISPADIITLGECQDEREFYELARTAWNEAARTHPQLIPTEDMMISARVCIEQYTELFRRPISILVNG